MTRVPLKKKVLSENDRLAAGLRRRFADSGTLALNLLSSPGAGKTALLERTLAAIPRERRVSVLTGDIETDNDARRLQGFGFPVEQISTGGSCHLDATMVERGLARLSDPSPETLFIENIGNLVCPSSFDLGEHSKVVVLSVTEGEDKPLKYPATFVRCDLVILNKIDLLPYVPFDLGLAREYVARVHPGLDIIECSCTRGEGIDQWLDWIETRRSAVETEPVSASGSPVRS